MKTKKIISAALVALAIEGAIVTACVARLVFDGLDITAWERIEEAPDGVECPDEVPEE